MYHDLMRNEQSVLYVFNVKVTVGKVCRVQLGLRCASLANGVVLSGAGLLTDDLSLCGFNHTELCVSWETFLLLINLSL
jgi:hypothetical protein